ncbi:MAG: hypothetical protein II984_03800 [Clostridia bacterium]|nr:hypothetical protein [Clostridia bacterium]
MRWYSYIPESLEKCQIIYNRKCPPNNSVYEEWITVGLENDGAQITFVEYEFYDKDPDGVREAYDCMYDSEYNITVDISKFDSQKLFVYTVAKDGSLITNSDIDIAKSKAIFIFTELQNGNEDILLNLLKQIENDIKNMTQILQQSALPKNSALLLILNDRL